MSNNLGYSNAKMVLSSIKEGVLWGSDNSSYDDMTESEIRADLKLFAPNRKTDEVRSALLKLANAKDLVITRN